MGLTSYEIDLSKADFAFEDKIGNKWDGGVFRRIVIGKLLPSTYARLQVYDWPEIIEAHLDSSIKEVFTEFWKENEVGRKIGVNHNDFFKALASSIQLPSNGNCTEVLVKTPPLIITALIPIRTNLPTSYYSNYVYVKNGIDINESPKSCITPVHRLYFPNIDEFSLCSKIYPINEIDNILYGFFEVPFNNHGITQYQISFECEMTNINTVSSYFLTLAGAYAAYIFDLDWKKILPFCRLTKPRNLLNGLTNPVAIKNLSSYNPGHTD